jgi:hypothetical protein
MAIIGMTLLGVGTWLCAVLVFMTAKSAVHEIEALILFLIGTVALSAVAIVDALKPRAAAATPLPAAESPGAGRPLTDLERFQRANE